MVTEHRKLGFDEELLSNTFALSSVGNGLVAVLAGILAQGKCSVVTCSAW